MKTPKLFARISPPTFRKYLLIASIAIGGTGLGTWYLLRHRQDNLRDNPVKEDVQSVSNQTNQKKESTGFVDAVVSQHDWENKGIVVKPVEKLPFSESIRLTGRVSLNEDQISHIYPMVEGSVDQVLVGLGQVVQADDVLVVVHSRVVGQAKLELYQARLSLETAEVKDKLQQEVAENTRELLKALRDFASITEIESSFRNRTMGEYRERLLLAYSNYLKSDADLQRIEGIASDGAISTKQLHYAQAARNADQATFQARIEQIEFELRTSLLLSAQTMKEASTRVAVAETNLRILGCEETDIEAIDPKAQGQAISDYSIRAPFAGTVISKDVTVREQIRPDAQIISIADLSTVWITADIYQQNVPLLSSIAGKPVKVHNDAWPDRWFEAKIFYTGEIMDESTRTISMRAVAENKEHLLKPGMFVTIELSGEADPLPVLQIPTTSVLEHQSSQFVFVHQGGENFQRREVKLGQSNQLQSVVLSGLNQGDQVVVEGGFILKSQMLAELMGEE